jgi:hypothetical protein
MEGATPKLGWDAECGHLIVYECAKVVEDTRLMDVSAFEVVHRVAAPTNSGSRVMLPAFGEVVAP